MWRDFVFFTRHHFAHGILFDVPFHRMHFFAFLVSLVHSFNFEFGYQQWIWMTLWLFFRGIKPAKIRNWTFRRSTSTELNWWTLVFVWNWMFGASVLHVFGSSNSWSLFILWNFEKKKHNFVSCSFTFFFLNAMLIFSGNNMRARIS